MRTVTIEPVIGAAIYIAGDAVGGLLDFAGLRQAGGGGGHVVSARLLDRAAQGIAIRLHLFALTFTATGDHDAFDVSDADAANWIGTIRFAAADYEGGASNRFAQVGGLLIPFGKGPEANTSLYGQLETDGTPTYGGTDLIDISVTAR